MRLTSRCARYPAAPCYPIHGLPPPPAVPRAPRLPPDRLERPRHRCSELVSSLRPPALNSTRRNVFQVQRLVPPGAFPCEAAGGAGNSVSISTGHWLGLVGCHGGSMPRHGPRGVQPLPHPRRPHLLLRSASHLTFLLYQAFLRTKHLHSPNPLCHPFSSRSRAAAAVRASSCSLMCALPPLH
jgi:hypothetical protein